LLHRIPVAAKLFSEYSQLITFREQYIYDASYTDPIMADWYGWFSNEIILNLN